MSSNLTSSFSQFKFGMNNSTEHSIYVFDEFKLDRDKMMLYRDGQPLTLPPKAVETLSILAEHHGQILSKDELIDAVWTDAIVEESNLSQYLYLLRKTLGSRPDGKPYIETLRRRGYRFTADVRFFAESRAGVGSNGVGNIRKERRTVERHGNVLAVVNWQESPQPAADVRPETLRDSVRDQPRHWRWAVTIGLASICLLVGASAAYYLARSAASANQPEPLEQNILRLTNGVEVVDATISPDGNYFVYHEPDGKLYRMYVQQTGQSTRHEIVPASELWPLTKTFTPDGQYVYFLAKNTVGEVGSLYRVPTFGGPMTKVMSDMDSGVSFSPDGREMVYYRNDKDGARFVIKASDGSGDERIIYHTTPGFSYAAWSPDGKSVAIQLESKREGLASACSLAVVHLETGELSPFSDELWDTCARMEWTPDGRALYMIGTRLGESTTPRREQVFHISYPQGRSRKMTHDGSRYQWSSLGVTKDGAVLAVPFNRSSQIWAMSPSGDSRTAVQLTDGQGDGRAGIAPLVDGRVAYVTRSGEKVDVWVMNQDGSDQKPITDGPNAIEEVRSGGDGRYLVFSALGVDKRAHLYRVNADGTGLKQITTGAGREVDSSISNDGKWIAYDSVIFFANSFEIALWKQSLENGERVSLNRNDCQMLHFSPDDKYISCVGEKDILILSSADGTLIRTLRVPQAVITHHTLNFGARWTPEGKAVAYIVNENGISNIWIHQVDGSASRRLTDFTGGSIYHFAYSLDGKHLYVARGHQIRDAILIKESKALS
jgi:DNA-binding winged helix-turn-helix (wHTH) protein/Tol biopolymer transport system component